MRNKTKQPTQQAPTGGGGEAKINRAINQLGNAERLIASLPKRYYMKREIIRQITESIHTLTEKIEQELKM